MRRAKRIWTALLVVALAVRAGAVVTTANTFGILRVDSTALRTIVAVPWLAGDGTNAITVADLVMTANLTPASDDYDGDRLCYYSDAGYKVWRLVAGSDGGAPQWSAVPIVSADATEPGTEADAQTLPRGAAFVLIRKNRERPIYLQGWVGATSSASSEIAPGTSTSPAYSLVAPPSVPSGATEIDLSTAGTWANVGDGDYLHLYLASGQERMCRFRKEKWQYATYEAPASGSGWMRTVWHDATVPVGTGFWYVSRSGTSPSVTWRDVPSVK